MAFGSKETVENVGKRGIGKNLEPGARKCKVLKVVVRKANYGKDRGDILYLDLNLESTPPSSDFVGFFIDKDNKELGTHTGQIGRVSTSSFGYDDNRKDKAGKFISKEDSIAQFLHLLCLEANGSMWVHENMGVHDTFEAFIEAFNKDLPIKDVFLNFVIGGSRSTDEKGFFKYFLSLATLSKGSRAAGLRNFCNDKNLDKLCPFDYKEFVYIKDGGGSSEVSSFGNEAAEPIAEVDDAPDFTSIEEDPFADDDAGASIAPEEDDEDPFAVD